MPIGILMMFLILVGALLITLTLLNTTPHRSTRYQEQNAREQIAERRRTAQRAVIGQPSTTPAAHRLSARAQEWND